MATQAQSRHTLWLLRHAKAVADPPPGGTDWDRVVAPRGRRDATALGRRFAGNGEGLGPALKGVPRPVVALVSPAARTAQTAELVVAQMAVTPELRLEEGLYGADPDEVIALLRALGDDAKTIMVVGHNPTMHTLSHELLAQRDKKGLSLAVQFGFPTCALGVYRFNLEGWKDVANGSAKLVALMAPPY